MIRFPLHPATMIFPEMSKNDFAQLVESIARHGQLEPVWLFDGQIIDGRHRQDACKQIGIDVLTREWSGDGSLIDFVCGLNLGRRHMSTEEKAVAAFRALPMYEAEAKERHRLNSVAQSVHLNNQDGRDVPIMEPHEPEPRSIERAASAFGVGKQYISDIKRIEREAPEVFKKIESGKITIPEAKRQIAAQHDNPVKPPIKWHIVGPLLAAALEQIRDAEDKQAAIETALQLLEGLP